MHSYNIVLVQPPGYIHALVFQDLGQLLLQSFLDLGLPCTLRVNAFDPEAVNIVLGYHLLPDPAVFEKCRCIPYQLEQLSERHGWLASKQPALLQKAFKIWDFSSENLAFLEAHGFKRLRLVPIGFHKAMQTIVPAAQDIDVLFYGSLNARRQQVLEELQKHCTVKALFGVYGAERDAFIARSRILLNIHYHDAQLWEQVRLSYLLNNRCFVVSEESVGQPLYEGGLVTAPYDQLVGVCRRYLADDRERERIAAAGFAWLRQRPMVEYLKAVVAAPTVSSESKSPRVSLCMIVKNEEATLANCLKTVADLVDEVVVVDTGSTDRTKAVAAGFGARVVDFAWVDSFAAARNASLDHATGEWILWMDADEWFDEEGRRKLRTLFAGLKDENVAYVTRCVSRLSPGGDASQAGARVQLFRKRPDIRWENRVHEQIVPAALRTGGVLRHTDVAVQHGGYQDAAYRLRKEERNLRLSQLDYAEQPDNVCVLYHLGKTLLKLDRAAEALSVLQRGLERADPGETLARKLYVQTTEAQMRLGRLEQALAVCQEGRRRFSDDLELLYLESYVRERAKDWVGAEACLRQILQTPVEKFCLADVDPALYGYRVHFNLAIIYRNQSRWAEAEAAWRAVTAAEPACTEGWIGLAEVYQAQARHNEMRTLLQQLQADPRRTVAAAALAARIQRFVQ